MKKIAILAARGFVGKSLTEYLKDKYQLYSITREDFSLLDEQAVKYFFQENDIDVIIHCGNQGGSRKSGYDVEAVDVIGNNMKMFFNIENCLTADMKLIHFGSGAQYNKTRDLIKITELEMGECLPKDDYGYSKYVLSKYIQEVDSRKKRIFNPIIFGLYGEQEDYTFKFISNAIIKNLLKMPIIINQNVIFDYLYIDDFMKIIAQMIEEDFQYREFNITPEKSIDLVSIAKLINQCSEFQSEIIVKNEGLNFQYTGSNEKLVKNVGENFSFTSYEAGITKMYRYYKENLGTLDTSVVFKDELLKYCKTK